MSLLLAESCSLSKSLQTFFIVHSHANFAALTDLVPTTERDSNPIKIRFSKIDQQFPKRFGIFFIKRIFGHRFRSAFEPAILKNAHQKTFSN